LPSRNVYIPDSNKNQRMKKEDIKKWVGTVLDDIFEVGIFIKFGYGILQLIAGLMLIFLSQDSVGKIFQALTSQELIEDPKDIIANFFIHISQSLSIKVQTFAGIYLLVHAAINIGLFILLWQKKRWAFPVAGSILAVLAAYQIYLISQTHSIFLLFLTIVDVLILLLLRFEYKRIYP